ncbi:hypothetical protein [Chachezhania antarctica]|uniref:hypothetical protein n=1 Tax=Chachezhania antarctica TaxID=2340860 RepID=UPI000EB0F4CD|nr:hypothetical protein [Chachezhania antarctica]|tara:strand:+ start:1076 stop:1357 length:282 start_codon:yes stop_codon:yes gene_type:complete
MSDSRKHRVVLDTPLRIPGGAVAAVVRVERSVWTEGSSGFTGAKWPLAVILCRDGELEAMAPNGDEMTVEEVDDLCPGASEAIRAAAESTETQ